MKRLAVLLLLLGLMLACTAPAAEEAQRDDSVRQIRMTFPTTESTRTEGLPEVQAAVNAIAAAEIGVTVELVPISAKGSPALYRSAIARDVSLDLMVLNSENILDYVNQDMLLPLQNLLERQGGDILAISNSLTEGTFVDGEAYGLRLPATFEGQCGCLWIDPARLEAVGFAYDPEKCYTLEELDLLLAQLKEASPDAYPLGQITNNYDFSTAGFFLGIISDNLSGNDPCVLPLAQEGTELVNYYEMEPYRRWLEYLRKWYLAGYIYPDSAITAASALGLYQAGVVQSVPQAGTPYLLSEDNMGSPIVAMRLSPIRKIWDGSTGVFWTIPVTSRDPEAAMCFLNLLYTDERLINLFAWGLEGRDYSLDEAGTPTRLETCTYVNPLGVFGDQRLCYERDHEIRQQARAEYSAQAEPVNPDYSGFTFDSSGLVRELLEIEQVEKQYVKLLEAGCLDLDTAYPAFLQALYDAGLQRVMDEKQRQFDAWLQQQSP